MNYKKLISIITLVTFGSLILRDGFVYSQTNPPVPPYLQIQISPRCIAVNPLTDQAVVTDFFNKKVSVIDLNTQTILSTITLSKMPLGVTIDQELNLAVVSHPLNNSVSVISLANFQVLKTISVGMLPVGISVDLISHKALISNFLGKSVSVIDLTTLTRVGTISVGLGPVDVAIDSELRLALVVNGLGNKVSVIDLLSSQVVRTVTVGMIPVSVSINPETHVAGVVNLLSNSLSVIDLQNWETRSIGVGAFPLDVAINSLDNRALIICDLERKVLLVDLTAGTIVSEYTFDNKRFTGVAIDPYMNIGALVDDTTGELTLIQLPNPVPAITSITPDTILRGSPATSVTIEGSGFIKSSIVNSFPVNFIDNHHLQIELSEVLLANAGTYEIVVTNPAPDGGSSNSVSLTINNPVPALAALDPSETIAGTLGLTLNILGTGFFSDTLASINGSVRGFSLIDHTRMQTPLMPEDVEAGGYLNVTAFNPPPGGGYSNALQFTVVNPAPALTSIAPDSVIAGSPDLTLTLNGDNFVKTSVVNFNSQAVVSTYISKTQLQATIPATAITTPGTYPVKVTNPTPGGGESAPLSFIVRPAALPPEITGFSPSEGTVGTIVTINGNNFDVSGLRVGFNGTSAIVSSFTKTSITTTVPMGTTTGPISVMTSVGSATSTMNFTVTSRYDFNLSITPQNAKAAPQSEISYIVSATGTEGFSNLVTLNIQGLPDGFSAYLSPKTITGGQYSTLTVSTCDCTLSSPATLTITGSTSIEGRTVTRSVNASLEMIAQGVTALTGLVLNTDKLPIKGVTIRVGDSSTTTDESGNFLLENPPTGEKVVLIDGFTASTDTAKYPTIPITMNIIAGQTNSLPFIPHFHAQKNYNFTPINRTRETIAEDPDVPGLQLRIPAGVDIIGWDGNPNTQVSIVKVPIDALPVPPPPPNVQGRSVYMFYFGKMGGGTPTIPIPVTAPNDLGLKPGEKAALWYFNESPNLGEAPNEWSAAGVGTVSDDGETISTDPGVGIPRFCCGAIVWAPTVPTGERVPPKACKVGQKSVEPSSGVFMHSEIDLALPGRIPITITRHHRSMDSFRGPYGIGTYFDYDWYMLRFGDTAVLVVPPGSRTNFSRQPNGSFVNNSEPMYRGAVVNFHSNGTSTLRMKDGMTYKFDGYGLLVEQQDRNGNKLTFLREVEGNVTRIIGADGRVMVTFSIIILGRDVITQMRDIAGRTVTYNYDYSADPGTGRLMSVTNPEGGVTQYQYDSQGRMVSIIDPRGNTTVNVTYDANGRVCQEQYADGGAYKYYYITTDQATRPYALRVLAEAQAGGPISTPVCSTLQTISPIAYTIAVDPNGNPTTYRFNNYQKIISVTDANGQTTITETDPVTNLVKSRTDALGRKTKYTYDVNGNVTSITDPAVNKTTIEYDMILNKPTKIIDALGNVTNLTYDSNGNPVQLRTPNSETLTIDYDQYGQPISVVDPMGNIYTAEFDGYGNLVKLTDPLGNSATRKYDVLSRLSEYADARGRKTTYTYDLMDRTKEVKDSLGGSTKFDYDPSGNLLSVTDAKGQAISYTYNSKDKVVTTRDQLGRTEVYQYDYNGNLIRMTDRKGQVTNSTYDKFDRRVRADYGDGSYTENTYDTVGRLLRIYDSISGAIEYEYANTGCTMGCSGGTVDKVIKETTPLGVISYTHDLIGRRTSMTVSGQPAVNYQYDPNSRLTEIKSIINGLAAGFSLRYDALGRRTSLTYPNGVTTSYTYDNASNLLNLQHLNPLNQILESFNYTYDPNGNRTNMQRANVPVKLPDPKSNITLDSTNRMLTFNDKTITYDDNGNVVSVTNSCGTTTYSWDARNRLVAINGFASALTSSSACEVLPASFKYDSLERRIEKTINGRTIQYVYDGKDIVQGIENGAVSTNYLRTLNIDEPLVRVESSGVIRYYQTDALGSVIALTDETGMTKTQYTYDSFGNVTISGEASENSFQYTGRENDGTGLYYYRARYYSPELQRFISEDPIGFAGGINFYAYVQNDPINKTDPEGIIAQVVAAIVMLVGFAIWGFVWWYKTTHPPKDALCPGKDKKPEDQPPGSPGVPKNFPAYQQPPPGPAPISTPVGGK